MEAMTTEDEEVSVLSELITSLELATRMAKKLPDTTNPICITRIHSTLHSAHHSLSIFLAHHSLRHLPPPFHPMDSNDDVDIDDVDCDDMEAGLRACIIGNKRPKRHLSPGSAAADEEEGRRREEGGGAEFDPVGDKSRGLDLVHQFHA